MPEGNPLGYLDPMIAQQPPQQVPMAPLDDETKTRLQAYVSQPAQPEGAFFSKIPVDPDEARKAEQRAAFEKEKENVQKKIFEADQRELDEQIGDVEKKKQIALKAGYTPEEVSARFDTQIADLTGQKAQMSLAVAPAAEQPAQMTLASDGPQQYPNEVAPQFQMPAPDMSTPGFDMQQTGIAMAAKAGAEQAAAEESKIRETVRLQDQRAALDEKARIDEQNQLAEKQKELDTKTSEVANLKVDAGQFWGNKSTGDKIMAGIGLFLGALGAAKDGVNRAAGIIENQIKLDVDTQEANIANRRAGLASDHTAFANMKGIFKDNQLARAATMAAGFERAENELKAISAKYKGTQASAQAMTLLGDLENRKMQYKAQVMQGYHNQLALASGDVNALPPDVRERFVPGWGLALTKEDASKFKDKQSTIGNSKNGLNELLSIAAKTGKSLSLEERAKAQTIAQALVGTLRVDIVGPGAMNEKEVEIMQSIIADPTKLFSLDSTNKARIHALMSRLDSALNSDAKARGLRNQNDSLGFTPKD